MHSPLVCSLEGGLLYAAQDSFEPLLFDCLGLQGGGKGTGGHMGCALVYFCSCGFQGCSHS